MNITAASPTSMNSILLKSLVLVMAHYAIMAYQLINHIKTQNVSFGKAYCVKRQEAGVGN